MKKVLKRLTVVDSQSPFHGRVVDIQVEDGFITEIGESIQGAGDAVEVDSHQGSSVSPGWVDLGAHLCDPGFEHKESMQALAKAAAFGGFTDVLCYPNTHPATDDASAVEALKSRARGLACNLHFMGTVTPGAHGSDLAEVYDMARAGAIAFSDGRRHIQSSELILRALRYFKAFGGLLLLYPDDAALSEGGQMNESVQSVFQGFKGAPILAETAMVARLLEIHAYAGGRLHLQPLTSARALEEIHAAKAKQPGLSTAVAISHLAWDDSVVASFDTHYKISPPLRDKKQRNSLIEAVANGMVDALCSYHQAQSVEEKLVEWPYAEDGMLALQTLFPLAMEHLVRPGHIGLEQLVDLLSHGPRRVLGLAPVSIDKGQKATLTVFDPEETWTFDKTNVFSRAVNSPLLGKALTGRAYPV